ncbi:MAG: hypothetical protein AAF414_13390 [Pseudomonadota bacterium]
MELNKMFAAVLIAGILAMIVGIIAEMLVHPVQLEEPAYFVDTGLEPVSVGGGDEVERIASIIPLLADADPDNGQTLTRACTACHNFEQGGGNGVGPNNWGVVGSDVAHVSDFNYSNTLQTLHETGVTWTYENLNRFLYQPRVWADGTTMSYAGMRSIEDRADLIAWLRLQADDPIPLPDEEAVAAATGATAAMNENGPATREAPDGEEAEEASATTLEEAAQDGLDQEETNDATEQTEIEQQPSEPDSESPANDEAADEN